MSNQVCLLFLLYGIFSNQNLYICFKNQLKQLILNKNLRFKYNPFGGISQDEVAQIIVPKQSMEQMLKDIHSEDAMIIQLVGFKGRGKTTHLLHLHQLVEKYPLIRLTPDSGFDALDACDTEGVFIDSIHHLPFSKRIETYKRFNKIILTTHITRVVEYLFARKNYTSYSIKGIEKTDLLEIIKRRITAAQINPISDTIELDETIIDHLLKKHKDNFRGIINELYQLHKIQA